MVTLGNRAIYKGKEYEFMDREEKDMLYFLMIAAIWNLDLEKLMRTDI